MRKELTDEWQRAGVTEHKDFAILTNVLTKAWSGMTTGEYKHHKGLTKEGGEVARSARADIESRLGHSVISSERASDYLRPIEDAPAQELPFDEGKDD